MKISYSYLGRQFKNIDPYLKDIARLVKSGDFTLGKDVAKFEENFSKLCKIPYAIGVSSGTDALILSLEILGIGHGDEVITAPNTFIATVGAIAMSGARPVFVDNNEEYTIDVDIIEKAIITRTRQATSIRLASRRMEYFNALAVSQIHVN